jgi:MOSC domain-containing protein YiiM
MSVSGIVESINVAAGSGVAAVDKDEIVLMAGKGIVGDRNYQEAGAPPATQVTLVEREQIEHFCSTTGLSVSARDTRRNVETSGVSLNALVGRRFRVGDVVLEGIELCEPCATLGRALQTSEVPSAQVVRAFTHRAGLRARIVEGGSIRRGDRITAT